MKSISLERPLFLPRDIGPSCQSVFSDLPSDPSSRDHFNAEKAFLDGWEALNVEYLVRYLMHWPQAAGPRAKRWVLCLSTQPRFDLVACLQAHCLPTKAPRMSKDGRRWARSLRSTQETLSSTFLIVIPTVSPGILKSIEVSNFGLIKWK